MNPIDIDSFAGGGGASVGIERATGKPVDIAVNHDPQAVAMHRANHPHTEHYFRNIWQVHPADIAWKRPVRLCWFSPDCTHHSKAKGSAPVRNGSERMSRDLAWVVVDWAKHAKPELIFLENVEEFAQWGPLLGNGKACPQRKGETFKRWLRALKRQGYRVQWRELRACDYGAPTIRKRLFLVARRDKRPVVWPKPTHGPGLEPYRSAAQCIDWSIPCPSIFLSKEQARELGCKRPLAEATMRRIARGVWKYVINASEPFIVPITHRGDDRVHAISEPLRTVTTAHRGELALIAPYFVQRHGERPSQAPRCHGADQPAHVITPTANSHMLVSAFLAQHNTGMTGHPATAPVSTIVQKGCTQAVIAAHLTRQFGGSVGQGCDCPAPTTLAGGGGKTGLVMAHLSHQYSSNTCGGQGDLRAPHKTVVTGGHHALVKAFLVKYYGDGGQWADCACPAPTITCKHRLGVVTVAETPYQIVDIGMRMLTPRELFRAQGFPEDYEIAPMYNGKALTKTAQIRMCGNSVCPQVAEALVRANL